MICGQCGRENREDSKFCVYCGADLTVKLRCRQCGAEYSAGDQFCMNCGAATRSVPDFPISENLNVATYGEKENRTKKFGWWKWAFAGLFMVLCLTLTGYFGFYLYFNGNSYNCKRYMELAARLSEEGKERKALYYYKAALGLDEGLDEAYLNAANIYMSRGERKDAQEILEIGFEKTGSSLLEEKLTELSDIN